MAKGIHDIGNGLGFIYSVEADGITIHKPYANTPAGVRRSRDLAGQSSPSSLNQEAVGSITVDTISGAGNITDVTIDTVNQIAASIAYTGTESLQDIAVLIKDAINSFTPASGFNYKAVNLGAVVYVIAPEGAGSTVNNQSISVSISANLTVTTSDLIGGANNTAGYDEANGFRFYIDADYGATDYSGGGTATQNDLTNAEEITRYFVPRHINGAYDNQAVTISGGLVSFTRKTAMTNLIVDTEGMAGADDLTDISPVGLADYDIVIIRGADAARIVSIPGTGNLKVNGNSVYTSGDFTDTIQLQYYQGSFYELSRSDRQLNTLESNSLFVDPTYGNDSSAKLNNPFFPYATIASAFSAATAGDTIFCRPGIYPSANLAINKNINFHFDNGAECGITFIPTSNTTTNITGYGKFSRQLVNTNTGLTGVIFNAEGKEVVGASAELIDLQDVDAILRFDKIESTTGSAVVLRDSGNIIIECDEMIGVNVDATLYIRTAFDGTFILRGRNRERCQITGDNLLLATVFIQEVTTYTDRTIDVKADVTETNPSGTVTSTVLARGGTVNWEGDITATGSFDALTCVFDSGAERLRFFHNKGTITGFDTYAVQVQIGGIVYLGGLYKNNNTSVNACIRIVSSNFITDDINVIIDGLVKAEGTGNNGVEVVNTLTNVPIVTFYNAIIDAVNESVAVSVATLNAKVIHSLAANVALSANFNNIITPDRSYVDSDVEVLY